MIKYIFITAIAINSLLLTTACKQQLNPRITEQQQIVINPEEGTDSLMNKYIEPYRDSIENVMNEVIGRGATMLKSFKPESPLTNFVADLTLQAGQQFMKESHLTSYPTLAVVNSKGLRSPLPEGNITIRSVFEVMPFENYLVAVKLTGKQVQQLFNHIVDEGGDGLSGASFTIDAKKAVQSKVQGSPLSINQYYWVFTNNYLAEGGDHYAIFSLGDTTITTNYLMRNIIIDGIKRLAAKNSPVTAPKNVRISISK
ncbi:5'-nucleotidase C-terminal domain-containing protein [Geofilum sp. OHC36d9]|uniref:5'-nucleotidase C-terminal domain-containing protein n=1 Tax=Geofilum sp. OHC36d9 TaxID=3458413 RepID=UPI004033CB61